MANGGIRTAEDGSFAALTFGNSDVARFGGATGDNSGQLAGFRNLLINSGFQVNKRGYISFSTLPAGSYGHDRWKGGAAGGDYTFIQLKSATGINIVAGKSIIQVVRDANVVGGAYVLSWNGTAKARVGVNTATPSGVYVISPIVVSGQLAGTTMSVEFTNDGSGGILSVPQLEEGFIASKREQPPLEYTSARCNAYCQYIGLRASQQTTSTWSCAGAIQHMIAVPVLTSASVFIEMLGTLSDITFADTTYSTQDFIRVAGGNAAAGAPGQGGIFRALATAEL